MIKFNEIKAENVKLMELAFKDMLSHIGVNVDVKVFGNLIYNGNELVCMESTTFNTVPAMYRGIKVDGSTLIYEDVGAEGLFPRAVPEFHPDLRHHHVHWHMEAVAEEAYEPLTHSFFRCQRHHLFSQRIPDLFICHRLDCRNPGPLVLILPPCFCRCFSATSSLSPRLSHPVSATSSLSPRL